MYIAADGCFFSFLVLEYSDDKFVKIGESGYGGSDLEEDYEFMEVARKCGLNLSWDEFVNKSETNILAKTNAERIFRILVSTENVDYDNDNIPVKAKKHVKFEGAATDDQQATSDEQETVDNSEWIEAYKALLSDPDHGFMYASSYAILYLDDDGIPEIITDNSVYPMEGQEIATYKNGKCEVLNYVLYYPKYIKGSGLLYSSGGSNGNYPFDIFKLDDNGFSRVAFGTIETSYDFDNGTETNYYYWGANDDEHNEELSQGEYETRLNKYFDFSNGITVDSYYTRDELITILNSMK